MALFDDDQLFSPKAPDSSLIGEPSSRGIGMGPVKDDLSDLSPLARGGLALQTFGNALQGKPDPALQMIEQKRRDRLLKVQEFRASVGAMEDGFKMSEKLTGDAKTKFIQQYAKHLNDTSPGFGDAFTSLSSKPDAAAIVRKYAEKSPTLQAAIEMDPSGRSAMKFVSSPEGLKTVLKETETAALPPIQRKVRTMMQNWQQLVPKEMADRFNKDGVITESEMMEANEYVRNHPNERYRKIALDDTELQVSSRNRAAVFGVAGILTGDKEQEVLASRAKDAGKDKAPATRTIQKGGINVQQEYRDGKWVEVGRGPKFKQGDGGTGRTIADRNTELKLADDYARDTKDFKDVRAQFESTTDYMAKVTENPKSSTSAGDRSLMFAYAKMNDPKDKVAVKDLQDIAKLAGVPERIIQAAKSLAAGTELSPRVRNEMYQEIKRRFRDLNKMQSDSERDYSDRATRYQLDTRNVVRKLSVDLPDDAAGKKEVGDIVNRGGKRWKVVGHDKDGEPLVEEVKK
jgi:hypothetical protein